MLGYRYFFVSLIVLALMPFELMAQASSLESNVL